MVRHASSALCRVPATVSCTAVTPIAARPAIAAVSSITQHIRFFAAKAPPPKGGAKGKQQGGKDAKGNSAADKLKKKKKKVGQAGPTTASTRSADMTVLEELLEEVRTQRGHTWKEQIRSELFRSFLAYTARCSFVVFVLCVRLL